MFIRVRSVRQPIRSWQMRLDALADDFEDLMDGLLAGPEFDVLFSASSSLGVHMAVANQLEGALPPPTGLECVPQFIFQSPTWEYAP
ncbi:uncharacterized protein LOC121584242 isoform X1 [Coregonus clupeaformis]|uniref:uncharacterized protein LOC121584242 isoform X1 n=1 Tax=Coregonus clupeaformis TaxID=59861 RepID=UPI001BDF9EC9|nr:uncharacterized protein LOC121584242 isoform X1 [Coregonus clupeaformis]